ncbi:DUF3515 family protein [Micromonospora rosaria]|uniref:DUF3515 family protein n=1 Tax=Micromonospora rosaria TaxID=47874 RepID=UPI0037C60283
MDTITPSPADRRPDEQPTDAQSADAQSADAQSADQRPDGQPADGPTGATPAARTPDRTNRTAALLATAVAVPVTLLVAGVAFAQIRSDVGTDAAPTASPTVVQPQSTTPVEMAAPKLAERPATVCRALLSHLPATVGELAQRPVTAGPEQNAAYGDPALTVACGGPAATVPDTDEVWTVNNVCWHGTTEGDRTTLTTLDREVPVRVSVPATHGQPLQLLPPLADAIVASVPSGGTPPTGCHR